MPSSSRRLRQPRTSSRQRGLLDRATIGEIEGIAFVACTANDKDTGEMGCAFRDSMDYPLARLMASALQLKDFLRSKIAAS
jgi:hypothetical protein